jgi:hypothetical protein
VTRIDDLSQRAAQARRERDRIGQLHATHLLSDSSDRQGCRCGHDSPMIKAGVRTAMITTRACPHSYLRPRVTAAQHPLTSDFAGPVRRTVGEIPDVSRWSSPGVRRNEIPGGPESQSFEEMQS